MTTVGRALDDENVVLLDVVGVVVVVVVAAATVLFTAPKRTMLDALSLSRCRSAKYWSTTGLLPKDDGDLL
jgi:hypothetical protein